MKQLERTEIDIGALLDVRENMDTYRDSLVQQ